VNRLLQTTANTDREMKACGYDFCGEPPRDLTPKFHAVMRDSKPADLDAVFFFEENRAMTESTDPLSAAIAGSELTNEFADAKQCILLIGLM